MKKIFYLMVFILECLLLAGAYIVNYFTVKKMGMLRYVVYKNQTWEAQYPVALFRNVSVILVIMITLLVLAAFIRTKKKGTGIRAIMPVLMVLLSGLYVGFALLCSTENFRAYYFISVLLGLAAFVQALAVCIAVVRRRHEK